MTSRLKETTSQEEEAGDNEGIAVSISPGVEKDVVVEGEVGGEHGSERVANRESRIADRGVCFRRLADGLFAPRFFYSRKRADPRLNRTQMVWRRRE